jgi:tetratricopeptide (TPR) repeat protein
MNRHQRRAKTKQSGAPGGGSTGGPPELPALFAQASRFHQAGNLAEAVSLYQQILRLDPRHTQTLYQFGHAARQMGRLEAAADLIGRAIERESGSPAYHNDLGNILCDLGRFEEAAASFARAVKLQPDLALAHFNLAMAFQKQGKNEEALQAYAKTVLHRPDHAQAHNNLGLAARALGRLDEAEAAFIAALGHQPTFAEAHCNLGMMFYERGRVAEALACFRHAVALQPTLAEAHNGLGCALERRGELEAAEASFLHAITHRPDYAEAHHNLGAALKELVRFDEAVASFDRALAFKPLLAEARYARGTTLLQTGDWRAGWRDYESRWALTNEPALMMRSFRQPLWSGEAGQGRTILLWAEQAFGDTIQFSRFTLELVRMGWRVVLEIHPELARLFSSLSGVTVVPRGESLPPFDCHFPLLSVPGMLGIVPESLPPPAPLTASQEATQRWRARLARGTGFRVGVNWRGRETQKRESRRAIRPEQFALCLGLPGLEVVSLQKDARQEEMTVLAPRGILCDAGPLLTDFAETAALMSNLDLVISSDTAVLHLAGALGVPAWGLLDHASDWHWLTGRNDSPWYPSVRLFRQPRRGDWAAVMDEVEQALATLLATRAAAQRHPA